MNAVGPPPPKPFHGANVAKRNPILPESLQVAVVPTSVVNGKQIHNFNMPHHIEQTLVFPPE